MPCHLRLPPAAVGLAPSAPPDPPAYLCVDAFLRDLVGTRALATALDMGLIAVLTTGGERPLADLAALAGLDGKAVRLLVGMLAANNVVRQRGECVSLTDDFCRALQYEDLLLAKIEFCALVATDFLELFPSLLAAPGDFVARARIFDLFSYGRALEDTTENRARTARWVRLTTALTRHEAGECLRRVDFSACRHFLDVGGNSGEFAVQVCRAQPQIEATVVDLPVVCELGRGHVRALPEGPRIRFVAANIGSRDLPRGVDVVSFKSMLHDWPDHDMEAFVAAAFAALAPGGSVLIFERGPVAVGPGQVPYSLLPLLLFFRSYRRPEEYVRALAASGFVDIQVLTMILEMPFVLIVGRKP